MLEIFKKYKPRKDPKYKKVNNDLSINAQNFYDGREIIINAFQDKIFLPYSGNCFQQQEDDISESDFDDDELIDERLYKKIFGYRQQIRSQIS